MTVFPRDVFQGLNQLRSVLAENFKLCCKATLPAGFDITKCLAPSDEISSCESLLRSHIYRVFLVLLASLAVVGNLFSFLVRVFFTKSGSKQGVGGGSVGRSGHSVFVLNLCVSDLLMGVYLVMIGVADLVYQGTYLWEEGNWRKSPVCQMAGFLSLLSNEVSALIICLITLDRFLAIRFPFSRFHFSPASSRWACLVMWTLGVVLAATPLLPVTSHWAFYSQTGICIPLPVSRRSFPGQHYVFSVIIVFNFFVFLLIAAGQASVYAAMTTNAFVTADASSRKAQDLVVARRLLVIVVTDFLCWFPIGLLGLLATGGVPIPGEVNVAMVILVLPLNSALNPFLYTVNMLLERRQRAKEEKLLKLVLSARDK
ncbi:G-protein coupled receptor GRL101-like [Littorina saxatilis]|uniref:G-protein coupled receptor GRL101-like n=1 Tax=Littorina saxatilis TaxID=31220 RepID=UPI0038B5BD77